MRTRPAPATIVRHAALAAALAGAAPLAAQGAGAPPAAARPTLVVAAENRTAAAEAARGAARRDTTLRPGDVVRYRLTFVNAAPHALRGLALRNPVPAGLRYVAGSARASRADVRLEYSADSGRTYAERPAEQLVVDGRVTERPVAPERFTAVRWTLAGELAPRQTVVAEYEARVAGPARVTRAAAGAR